jgi:hypothetical protein
MLPPRDQLIAAWRQQLSDAESVEREAASRAAWLRRLKLRLYRFLLSLYGEGVWNAPQSAEHAPADAQQSALVIDETNVLPLAGKPAKAEDKIRAVLQSVADNQDHRPSRGPLTAEKLACEWFIVASQNSRLDLTRCQLLLTFIGIDSRLRPTATDVYLEVPGRFHQDAIYVLDQHLEDLRLKPHRSRRARPAFALSSGMVVLAVLLLYSVPQVFLAFLALESYFDMNVLLPMAFAAVLVVTLMLLSLREVRRQSLGKSGMLADRSAED